MITGVKGTVSDTGTGYVLLNVGVFTLEVQVPASIIPQMENQAVTLFTHLRITNDQPVLYGFPSQPSLNLFLRLITISGVGPKIALALMSYLKDDDLKEAISSGNAKALTAVTGVGAGTASKIIRSFR